MTDPEVAKPAESSDTTAAQDPPRVYSRFGALGVFFSYGIGSGIVAALIAWFLVSVFPDQYRAATAAAIKKRQAEEWTEKQCNEELNKIAHDRAADSSWSFQDFLMVMFTLILSGNAIQGALRETCRATWNFAHDTDMIVWILGVIGAFVAWVIDQKLRQYQLLGFAGMQFGDEQAVTASFVAQMVGLIAASITLSLTFVVLPLMWAAPETRKIRTFFHAFFAGLLVSCVACIAFICFAPLLFSIRPTWLDEATLVAFAFCASCGIAAGVLLIIPGISFLPLFAARSK